MSARGTAKRGEMKFPRKCKHLVAITSYLRELGAEDITSTRGSHIRVAWLYRGTAMAIMLPSTPRDEDAAIGIARQQIRRRLREAGFDCPASAGAKA